MGKKDVLVDLNGASQIAEEEFKSRRKLRLMQVRMQERCIAKLVRLNVAQKRQQEIEMIAQKLEKEFEARKMAASIKSKQEYSEGLKEFGKAHKSADDHYCDPAMMASIWERNKKIARQRYTEALQQLHMMEDIKQEKEKKIIQRRRMVAKKEMVRAQHIAALPIIAPTISTESSNVSTRRNLTQSSLYSTFNAERATANESEKDARKMAEEEEEREKEDLEEKLARLAAQREKAHIRHLTAMQHSRMQQEAIAMEHEIKMLQRKDASRRRENVTSRLQPVVVRSSGNAQLVETEKMHDLKQAFESAFATDCNDLNHWENESDNLFFKSRFNDPDDTDSD